MGSERRRDPGYAKRWCRPMEDYDADWHIREDPSVKTHGTRQEAARA